MAARVLRMVMCLFLLLPGGFRQAGSGAAGTGPAGAGPVDAGPVDQSYRVYLPISDHQAAGETCQLIEQSPWDGVVMRPGTDFDGFWVVRNTGKQTWHAGSAALHFVSGTWLQISPDPSPLYSDVAPGKQVTLVLAMRAPEAAGSYAANWMLVEGQAVLCRVYMSIRVVE